MQNLKPTVKTKLANFLRRKIRVNANIKASHPDFRIVINKSNKYIKAQLLDKNGNVLGVVSDKDAKGETKSQRAQQAGQQLAKIVKEKNIQKVAFDRNGYLYHGRVKAFADGVREGGVAL